MDAEARKEMEDLKVGFDLRPSAQVYNSYKEYRRAQNQASRAVTIGRFIAFFVDWTGVPVHKRQKFWLGKVTDISETTVTVHYYHTSQRYDSDYKRAFFKPWTGKDKKVTVGRNKVIDVFDKLTESGFLPAKHRRYILDYVRRQGQGAMGSEAEDDEEDDDDDEYKISDMSEDGDGDSMYEQKKRKTPAKRGKSRKRKSPKKKSKKKKSKRKPRTHKTRAQTKRQRCSR